MKQPKKSETFWAVKFILNVFKTICGWQGRCEV